MLLIFSHAVYGGFDVPDECLTNASHVHRIYVLILLAPERGSTSGPGNHQDGADEGGRAVMWNTARPGVLSILTLHDLFIGFYLRVHFLLFYFLIPCA